MTNFSIIIPNFNGEELLKESLLSLKQGINNCPRSNFEIILVDNASTDNSLKIFESIISQNYHFSIILNSSNFGFAKSVNQGIQKAKHEYVVLLNNDITIDKDWFKIMSKTIEQNKKGKISTFYGTVLNKDGTKFESQGLKFFYSGKALNISNDKVFNPKVFKKSQNEIIFGAPASLVVYQKKIIEKAGLFDADFFAYLEDLDLSLRLHRLKYKTLYVPQALSYHLGGATSNLMKNLRSRLSYRNWFYIIIKNYSLKDFIINLPEIIIQRLKNLSYFLRQSIQVYGWKVFYLFPLDFIKTSIEIIQNTPKMFNKRKSLQKLIESNHKI